jgi:hypothetical protein
VNRQQIIEQAETMLGLLSTLDPNEVAQVLGTALILHTTKCSATKREFIDNLEMILSDTVIYAHKVKNSYKIEQ